MRRCAVILTVLSFIVSTDGKEVAPLTASNFNTVVNVNEVNSPLLSTNFVVYYAPWCKYSKDFLPVYEEMATHFTQNDIAFYKVDCVREPDIYYSEDIESLGGFPILKAHLPGGHSIVFNEDRSLSNVMSFVDRMSRSSLTPVDSYDGGVTTFVNLYVSPLEPVLIVYSFPSAETKREDKRLLEFVDYSCKYLNLFRCGLSSDSKSLDQAVGHAKVEIEKAPIFRLVMYRGFSKEASVVVSAEIVTVAAAEVLGWVARTAFPTTVALSMENEPHLFGDKRPGFNIHVLIVLDSTKMTESEISEVLDAARAMGADEFSGKCVFVYADAADDSLYTKSVLSSFDDARSPTVFIVSSQKTQVQFFQLNKGTTLNADSLLRFTRQYFDKALIATRTIQAE